jgi:hemerythrin-like domain-containing protein
MATKKTKNPTYVDLLKEDHRKVQALFKQFEKTEDENEKKDIVNEAIQELKIHSQLEEEIVYPALREVEEVEEEELIQEAEVEHQVAKDLIAELEQMDSNDELYCAKFTVLGEYINHHIEEEESEIFSYAKETDKEELTQRLIERKEQLMNEIMASR